MGIIQVALKTLCLKQYRASQCVHKMKRLDFTVARRTEGKICLKQQQLVCLSNTLMADDHSQKEVAFIKKTLEVFTKKMGKAPKSPPPSLRWKTWQSKAFFSTKIPFLLTIFICQTHFLFLHSNFIQKSTRVPRRSRGKTLHKRRLLIYFSHSARCSSLILITCRPPTAD